ncbi:MAG: helix-turn-helix transcriptional regulator [Deltaproteobacteria bacterium]|nr:helix-turn-helix transcriptional regulator [Deltaproteobacteria bacterium]
MGSQVEKRLGRQVAGYRDAAKLTQEQLAEKVGVTVETISRLERGASTPSVERLEAVAIVLGIELRDLFTFESARDDRGEVLTQFVRELRRRKPEDVELIRQIAGLIFERQGRPGRARR